MSGMTPLRLLPAPPRAITAKTLSEMETKEERNVDMQSPSVRNTGGSVFHWETRTCYYQPKYQNPGQRGGRRTPSLRSIERKIEEKKKKEAKLTVFHCQHNENI